MIDPAAARAVSILSAASDPARFTAVTEQLRLGRARVVLADEDLGVLTRLGSGCYFCAPFDGLGALAMASFIPAGSLANIADAAFAADIAAGAVPSAYELWVHGGTTVDAGEARLTMVPLSPEDLDTVCAHYGLLPREQVLDHLERSWIAGGYDASGELVGFIGEHEEGSMGMLEVFPAHRRRGYARALEAALIDDFLAAGRVPYCHVAPANAASLALQASLGLRRVGPVQCWVEVPAARP